MSGIYLEPIGLIYGSAAREAMAIGAALPLAGGPIAFGAVRFWEGEPGNIKHAIARTVTIEAIDDNGVRELLHRLTSPRLAIAGLSMDRPHVMGIVNVTPDSFSDGGQHGDKISAITHGQSLIAEGAEILDIGGESTRPGADLVGVEEELSRVIPVIEGLTAAGTPISIDTRKPDVMKEAVKAGAGILNDVSGLTFVNDSVSTVASLKLPTIVMHAQGDPKTMQDNPVYKDVVVEVYDFLESRIEAAVAAGLPRELIVADPGVGFGKTSSHNLSLFASLSLFHGLGVPLLIGASRKGLIGALTGGKKPTDRLPGSLAAALAAVSQGVQFVRAHDVSATRQALSIWLSTRAGQEIAIEAPGTS